MTGVTRVPLAQWAPLVRCGAAGATVQSTPDRAVEEERLLR
jgi:hypothetical protein